MQSQIEMGVGNRSRGQSWLGVVLLVLSLICRPSLANSPQLSSTEPAGAQRGTELEVAFHGERLNDAREILWYSPGVEVLSLEIPTNQAAVVKARLKLKPDCQLGEHSLRIRCDSGLSDLRTFWVSAMPSVKDAGTNTDFAHPQLVALNSTIEGVADNEVVHYYRVEAKKGERISAEVEGMRLGRTQFDPFVAIMNSGRFVQSSADDTALLLQDPACSFVAAEDGPFFVEVRESTYGGNGSCRYRLHLGGFPRPTGVYPAGGKAGEVLKVTFLGEAVGDLKQEFKLPEKPTDKFGVFAEQEGLISPSPNWVRVSAFPNVLEIEPNDDREHATDGGTNLPIALNGIISKNGDADWFRFRAEKGKAVEINAYARRLRSPLDSVISVHDAKGNSLADNDDAEGPDSYLRFNPPETGDYWVRIRDHLSKGGADFIYRLELTPVEEVLNYKVPDVSRNNAQERKSIVVPRGNRFALLIQAERKNFNGELAFQAPDLPAGVTLACDHMPQAQNQLPLVFEATADAPIAGKLCELSANPTNNSRHANSKLAQDYVFVRGEPGDSIYSQLVVDKIAASVVAEVPFKIRVIEPKVPIVRAGSMDLNIVAERKPGFEEPITVRMLYNPPGIGSASEITIPKGQTNALYRLNANGDAEIRPWKIALLGSATVGGAPAWVSTQLASLTVSDSFVAMKIEMASIEPGQTARVLCQLEQKAPFEGKAVCKLFGLPNAATCADTTFTKDDKQVVFEVTTTDATPIGQHKSLFCSVTIMKDGEPILHSVGGGGILRVDKPKPAPAKEVAVAAKPTAATPPPAAKPVVEKPLSRIEKLRLEHAEKRKQELEKDGPVKTK